MNENDLRALVRAAVERHLGHRAPTPVVSSHLGVSGGHGEISGPHGHSTTATHPSLVMYLTLVNEGEACLIEPTVTCNHCGYCKSHGH